MPNDDRVDKEPEYGHEYHRQQKIDDIYCHVVASRSNEVAIAVVHDWYINPPTYGWETRPGESVDPETADYKDSSVWRHKGVVPQRHPQHQKPVHGDSTQVYNRTRHGQ